jgi:septal ring factor EnvC (AmiA/AmiB activator)
MADLDAASKYILEQETRIHEQNKTSNELLKQLKDCEGEIDTLKAYIIDLKSRIAVYIPV